MSFRLYMVQRLTAVAMVPFLVAHLVLILYATRHGLSAADILARTRGSLSWGAFYVVFIALAATHGAIGVRNVVNEATKLTAPTLNLIMWTFGSLLALLGLRAVMAVVAS
jgi:fumarate reductase subunit C